MNSTKKPRSKTNRVKKKAASGIIDFNFGETLYQIDPGRRKVYRNWVEVETSKTFVIMGAFSNSRAQLEAK